MNQIKHITDTWPIMYNNTIYSINQSVGLCGYKEKEFQLITGMDKGTVIKPLPTDNQLIQMARNMLFS